MAGVSRPVSGPANEENAVWTPVSGGAFSPLARAQYAALARMRWNAFRNGLRTSRGMLEATASTLNYLVYVMMGLGLSVGMGAGAYSMASKGEWFTLPILLWALFAIWQAMPIFMASFQQQFDLTGLLRLPLGFAPFLMLHVVYGVIDAGSIFGCLGCLGLWIGLTAAIPGLFAWAAVGLVLFGAFNVLLSRAIFAWLDRWLAQRKTREVLSVLFVLALLGLQFLNPAVRGHRHHTAARMHAQTERDLVLAEEAQEWLPPGLAVRTLEMADGGGRVSAIAPLGLLGIYGMVAGLILSARLRAEYRGESLGEAPKIRKREKRAAGAKAPDAAGNGSWLGGAGPIGAMIEKDLRTVMRSMPLLYALGAPLLMVFVLASLMHGSRHSSGDALPIMLPMCIAYALLGFTQLIYNNLGAEGPGIQLIFFSPTPMRTVMLAKNIFHGALFCVIALAAGTVAALRLGTPNAAWLWATGAWVVFALPAHLAAGNIFSLTMPHRINLGRIGRQRGGRATALLAMLVQVVILAVGAAVIALCALTKHIWIATPLLLALSVPAFLAWMRVLANADAMAGRRRDELITALAKAE